MDRSYSSPLLSMPTIKSRKFPFAFNTFAIAKSLSNVVPLDILLSMVAAMVSSRFDPSVRCKNSRIISMAYLKSCNIHSFLTTSSLSTCDFKFSSIVLPMLIALLYFWMLLRLGSGMFFLIIPFNFTVRKVLVYHLLWYTLIVNDKDAAKRPNKNMFVEFNENSNHAWR